MKYGCYKLNNGPAKLFRIPKTSIPKTGDDCYHYLMACMCQLGKKTSEIDPRIRLVDTSKNSTYREFLVQVPMVHKESFCRHFFLRKEAPGLDIPEHIQHSINSMVLQDPYSSPSEILQEILSSNTQPITQKWLVAYIIGQGHEKVNQLLDHIKSVFDSVISDEKDRQDNPIPTNFRIPHGSSAQTAIAFSLEHTYTKYIKPIEEGTVFECFQDFMQYFEFPSPSTVICIPVWDEMFTGTGFQQSSVDRAKSCILFTSPIHIWAIHQLWKSSSHDELTLFSMDGIFSIPLLRAGSNNTVIMSLGFLDLNVHDTTRSPIITRKFVPSIHCLAISESAPAAFLCLHALSRVYQQFTGNSLNIHSISADSSAAIASGVATAFPNTKLIVDIEHLRASPYKNWASKIVGGKESQRRISYWISLLYHSRSRMNYQNAWQIFSRRLTECGEQTLSNFLNDKYGPDGTNPWIIGYNISRRVGMFCEQQPIENYYGLIKPNTKLGRKGALKIDVGMKYVTQEGIASLLKFDHSMINKLTIGSFSELTLDALRNPIGEHIVLALLMEQNKDYKAVSLRGRGLSCQRFLGVPGFLCNGPRCIGQEISQSDIQTYVAENSIVRDHSTWTHGFRCYATTTQRFCLLRPIHAYSRVSEDTYKEVKHLLCLPDGSYFCNCPLYWSRLNCPASIFINDMKGIFDPPLDVRRQLSFSGRNTSLTNRDRRRGARPAPQPIANWLWESLGLTADFRSPTLCFLAVTLKSILVNSARMRHPKAKPFATKTEAIVHILAGTELGVKAYLNMKTGRTVAVEVWNCLQEVHFGQGAALMTDQEYSAMSNPFPEGKDIAFPESCKSYWLNIPNVEITIAKIHIMAFLFACEHVSTPGTNGVVSESIFTANARMAKFYLFHDQHRNIASISEFLPPFHEEYLHQASVVDYNFPGNHSLSQEERYIQLSSQIDFLTTLLQLQPDQENIHATRLACVIVYDQKTLVIMKKTSNNNQNENIDEEACIFHAIIPKKRPYFIGSNCLYASTWTILRGLQSLRRFIMRLMESHALFHNAYPDKIDCWVYKQVSDIQPDTDATVGTTETRISDEVDEDDINSENDFNNGLSIEEIAHDNETTYLEEVVLSDDDNVASIRFDENDREEIDQLARRNIQNNRVNNNSFESERNDATGTGHLHTGEDNSPRTTNETSRNSRGKTTRKRPITKNTSKRARKNTRSTASALHPSPNNEASIQLHENDTEEIDQLSRQNIQNDGVDNDDESGRNDEVGTGSTVNNTNKEHSGGDNPPGITNQTSTNSRGKITRKQPSTNKTSNKARKNTRSTASAVRPSPDKTKKKRGPAKNKSPRKTSRNKCSPTEEHNYLFDWSTDSDTEDGMETGRTTIESTSKTASRATSRRKGKPQSKPSSKKDHSKTKTKNIHTPTQSQPTILASQECSVETETETESGTEKNRPRVESSWARGIRLAIQDSSDEISDTKMPANNDQIGNKYSTPNAVLTNRIPESIVIPATMGPELTARIQSFLDLGYIQVNNVIDLSHEESSLEILGNEQVLREMQLSSETCCVCLKDMWPELDKDSIVRGSRCNHLYHYDCFMMYCQKAYVIWPKDEGTNFCHRLLPAIKCMICQQYGGWKKCGSHQPFPDGKRVFAIHTYKDVWGMNDIVCNNWITCPILYKALCQNLVVKNQGVIHLPIEYETGNVTEYELRSKAIAYFENAIPLESCVLCKTMNPIQELLHHQPYSSDGPICTYKVCLTCFTSRIFQLCTPPEDKSEGKLHCPTCARKFCFYKLTGQRANTIPLHGS